MPMHPSETNPEAEVEATIAALAEQAASCAQSPSAPDGAGWGVPDWQDKSAYPAADELDDLEWRWEFLRRNHGYRLDWLRAAEEFWPCPRERYFQGAYDLFGPINPRHSIRNMPGFAPSTEPKTKTLVAYRSGGRAPFREVLLTTRFAEFWELERIIRRPPHFVDVYVRYDLSRPIEPQAAEIKSLLIQLRREAFSPEITQARQRQSYWPVYLRLLDAADSSASLKEMASILRTGSRNEQNARDLLKAAEHLRQWWRH